VRRDRGPDYENFEALIVAVTFAIGFCVLFANHFGFVTSSQMPPVLFTANAAYFAGAFAHRAAMQVRYRAIVRSNLRHMAAETLEVKFDAGGLVYSNAKCQVRVPWVSVGEVIEDSLVVVLMFGRSQGLAIPARLFSDSASRTNFVAVTRECVSDAGRQP
jgi:hypothetical protein